MARYGSRRFNWVGLPLIGTVARLLCRELTLQNEYLQVENRGVKLSKSAISDALRRNGLPPAHECGGLTWCEFLARQAHVLLCTDLFTKEIWTFCGLRRALVLVVMHLKSRTILLAEATCSPHSGWMAQQVRNTLMVCHDLGIRPHFLPHDRDKCFAGDFDAVVQSAGVESLATPYHAPNANAHCERWIRSARQECLNHLIPLGLKSLQRVVHTYRAFHSDHRPHQGIGNRVPRAVRTDEPALEPVNGAIGKVHCEESLGGLLTSYRRAS